MLSCGLLSTKPVQIVFPLVRELKVKENENLNVIVRMENSINIWCVCSY